MKIILISAIFSDLGICSVSPLLKNRGHCVKLLFIPELLKDCLRSLSNKATNRIIDFIEKADLIGINSLSENYYKTALLVDDIKKVVKSPVIWGGIHATLNPKDCLKHADIVCVGEGELPMLELAERFAGGRNVEDIKNLLFHPNNNNEKKLELYPPIDLDSLLSLDYDLDSQYLIEDGRTRNVKEYDFKGVFNSFSSRGCPFVCTYCCNVVVSNMYKGQGFLRQRSIENILKEVKGIKECFSSCREIWFNEADFLSGKTQEEIEEFARRYKGEVNVPFSIWSSPNAVNDANIKTLKTSGLKQVNIGTLNASKRIQLGLYNRNAMPDLYLAKAKILKKYAVKTEYDLILCNPYENDDDIISTIELLIRLAKPFKAVLNSLTYFPKTPLYEMALKDGIINKNQYTPSYTKAAHKVWEFKHQSRYLNIVFSLTRGRARRIGLLGFNCYGSFLPEPVLKFLIKRPVIKFFNHFPFRAHICHGIANLILIGNTIGEQIYKNLEKIRFSFRAREFKN